jgi:hypothetical protein
MPHVQLSTCAPIQGYDKSVVAVNKMSFFSHRGLNARGTCKLTCFISVEYNYGDAGKCVTLLSRRKWRPTAWVVSDLLINSVGNEKMEKLHTNFYHDNGDFFAVFHPG